MTSIILTAAFLFVFNVLLSETSEYCMVPASLRVASSSSSSVVPAPLMNPLAYRVPPNPSSPSIYGIGSTTNRLPHVPTRQQQSDKKNDEVLEVEDHKPANITTNPPTSEEVEWAQQLLRRHADHSHSINGGGDYSRLPEEEQLLLSTATKRGRVAPSGHGVWVEHHNDEHHGNWRGGDETNDYDDHLSFEEKFQKRLNERDGTAVPVDDYKDDELSASRGGGTVNEKMSGEQLEPAAYSGAGVLYDDADNECDITRSTTLSFARFEE